MWEIARFTVDEVGAEVGVQVVLYGKLPGASPEKYPQ